MEWNREVQSWVSKTTFLFPLINGKKTIFESKLHWIEILYIFLFALSELQKLFTHQGASWPTESMQFHNLSLCPACWRCYRKPLWSWREQQRWWEEERPMCLKCMLPDGYTRSSIKISKINLGDLSELGGVLSWFPAVQSKYFHTLGICQRGVWGNGVPEALWLEVPTSSSRGMWRRWGNLWTIWDQSQKGSEDTDFAIRGKWPKLQMGPRMTV